MENYLWIVLMYLVGGYIVYCLGVLEGEDRMINYLEEVNKLSNGEVGKWVDEYECQIEDRGM